MKNVKKSTILLLCLSLLLPLFTLTGISAQEDGNVVWLYSEDFGESSFDELAAKGLWEVEKTGDAPGAKAPAVTGGVYRAETKQSASFFWQRVPNAGDFDASKTYVFDYDIRMTDAGNGTVWVAGVATKTRAIYIGNGGYFNQLELPMNDNRVRAGDSYMQYSEATFLNQWLHVTMTWKGNNFETVISSADGTKEILSGSRTKADFVSMSANNACMTFLAFRSEDGAFEMDNFRFGVDATGVRVPVSETGVNIPSGSQAVYAADLAYDGTHGVSLFIGGVSLFELSPSGLTVCGDAAKGSFDSGTYGVKAFVNPAQKMVYLEITLPGGGVMRRGTYSVLTGCSTNDCFYVFSENKNCVQSPRVTYAAVTLNSYTLNSTEPQGSGFTANVYNLVSSFEIPQTTRLFAWTARASYIGASGEMALYYRKAGETKWNEVKADRRVEKTSVASEDYFTADLTGLTAATEYEYYFGKCGASPDTADGSKIFRFKTAEEKIKAFDFVAIGDTQGVSWNGTNTGTKGFMYADAALTEAFKAMPDAAFILHTGDVVENGTNIEQWNRYFKALGSRAYGIPHFVANGNHDMQSIDGAGMDFLFNYHFNHPNNGGKNAIASGAAKPSGPNAAAILKSPDEMIYSFNYGEAHFVVYNSGCYGAQSDDGLVQEAQRAWLEADLEANKGARWTILLAHMPVYHRLGGVESRPWLGTLIEKYVDLAIMGHSHLVTRTYPMKNGKIVTKSSPDLITQGTGTVYTTIGSTTLNHDTPGNPNMEEIMLIKTPIEDQATYTTVSVSETEIVVTTTQLNGLVLDSFTIQSTKPITTDEPEPPETEPVAPETEPLPPETEPVTEPETAPETKPVTEPESEPETEPETEAITEAETKPETDAETAPVTEPGTEAGTDGETKAGTETDPGTETVPGTDADSGTETDAETDKPGKAPVIIAVVAGVAVLAVIALIILSKKKH